ncbi:MAG TPA: cytochrome c [Burkholderiales bacterium]|nr:cytochrome c [Burkholderiales bacterium]
MRRAWFMGMMLVASGTLAWAEDRVQTELYTVVDGYKVDPGTMQGFRTWRAAACDRCHGANQQGLVGPSLIDSLKTLSRADFDQTILEGRMEKGMPRWKESKLVVDNLDHLYAYLKGRSDGAITRSKVEPLK